MSHNILTLEPDTGDLCCALCPRTTDMHCLISNSNKKGIKMHTGQGIACASHKLDTSDTSISTVNACLFLQSKSGRNVLTSTSSTAILSGTDTAWVRVSLLFSVQWCPDFRGRPLKTAMPNQLHCTYTGMFSHTQACPQHFTAAPQPKCTPT